MLHSMRSGASTVLGSMRRKAVSAVLMCMLDIALGLRLSWIVRAMYVCKQDQPGVLHELGLTYSHVACHDL